MRDDETPDGRVFFLHVMKTGGNTLKASVRDNFEPHELYPGPEDIFFRDTGAVSFRHFMIPRLRAVADERRRSIRVYMGHFPYVAREVIGGDLTTITLLRDPVDRTISMLRQLQRPWWLDPNRTSKMHGLSVEELYEHPRVYEHFIHNHQTKIFSMTLADDPQGFMQVIDVDASRLALAKENLERVEVLGLTERYDDLLDDVSERFGWRVQRGTRLNAAPESSRSEVSASLRRRIIEDNAIDLELYEHARELVDRRHQRARA
jgi:hypothetical protein